MVKVATPRAIHTLATDADGRPIKLTREAIAWFQDLWRRTGGTTDSIATANDGADSAASSAAAAQTAADAAQTAADAAAATVRYAQADPQTALWSTDSLGAWPAGNPSQALSVTFVDADGATVATRTLTGTLDSTTGVITVVATSDSGESTTATITGSGTRTARARIDHDDVNASLTISWTALDISIADSLVF